MGENSAFCVKPKGGLENIKGRTAIKDHLFMKFGVKIVRSWKRERLMRDTVRRRK